MTSSPPTTQNLRALGLGAFFRPRQLEAEGISYDSLRKLVTEGTIEHVSRGLYRLADEEPGEDYTLAAATARVPRSVVCLLSALRVHGIGSSVTREVWLAIPHKARAPRLQGIKLRLLRFSGSAWSHGVVDTRFEGVRARITNPARTVVDCFRFRRLIGRETAIQALDDALRRRITTIAGISRILEVLPSRDLRAALELRAV